MKNPRARLILILGLVLLLAVIAVLPSLLATPSPTVTSSPARPISGMTSSTCSMSWISSRLVQSMLLPKALLALRPVVLQTKCDG